MSRPHFALLMCLLAACGRDRAAEEPLPPLPPRLLGHQWSDGDVLTVEGFTARRLEFSDYGSGVSLMQYAWPDDTIIEVAGVPIDLEELVHRPNVVNRLGEMDLSPYEPGRPAATHRYTLPITIRMGGRWLPIETDTPEAEISAASARGLIMTTMREGGPLTFEGEPENDPRDTALTDWRTVMGPEHSIIGEGRLAREVDWVIREHWEPTGDSRRCGGYSTVPGLPGNTHIDIAMNESVLVVTDRRTGGEVARERFAASRRCPGAAFAGGDGVGSDRRAMVRWVERWVRDHRETD